MSLGPTVAELQQLLYAALGEPIGLVLTTSDAVRARQRLYAARKAAGDPALARLQIRISPLGEGEEELVITKGAEARQRSLPQVPVPEELL